MSEDVNFYPSTCQRMVLMATAVCFFVFITAGGIISTAQDNQTKDVRYYESQAFKAYQEKNYAAFLESMKAAQQMRPDHPRLMYNRPRCTPTA